MKKLLIAAVALTALAVPASAGGFSCNTVGINTTCTEDPWAEVGRQNTERRARKAAAKEELFWVKAKGGMPADMVDAYCDMYADKYGRLFSRSSYFKQCITALK